ncbi:MAG: hypothetical protein GX638_09345 [Crenarchaeota archaeon]|nr:hypothetical protein [Thermoproteota archaeon]
MYKELFATWQQEINNSELGRLPTDFYTRLHTYLSKLDELKNTPSEKSLKTNLVTQEALNSKRMVEELITIRYKKLVILLLSEENVPVDALASQELQLYNNLSPSTNVYNQFASSLTKGQKIILPQKTELQIKETTPENQQNEPVFSEISTPQSIPASDASRKLATIRFLKMVPAIIGSDMKTYGPFMVEDVASVPESNARILIRQSLAKPIELP